MNYSSVQKNIVNIQQAFNEGKNLATVLNIETLSEKLEDHKNFFSSAKFEGAAYQIALTCCENSDCSFTQCRLFFKQNPSHQIQIAIGFGWATAEYNITDFQKNFNFLPIDCQQKMADGFGYYEGIFRKRKCFVQKIKPKIADEFLPFYFSGLGRSLWYVTQGDIEKVKSAIEEFPKETQCFFWQGVGTALAYVGGFERELFMAVKDAAASNFNSLREGIFSCFRSRQAANLLTDDLMLAMEWL